MPSDELDVLSVRKAISHPHAYARCACAADETTGFYKFRLEINAFRVVVQPLAGSTGHQAALAGGWGCMRVIPRKARKCRLVLRYFQARLSERSSLSVPPIGIDSDTIHAPSFVKIVTNESQ
jgi:hypothetical protein